MSTLLRLARSQGIKSKLKFLTPKDIKMCSAASRSDSPIQKVEKADQPYTAEKPWVSYGFHYTDKKFDRQAMHVSFFVLVSICLVFGALGVAYIPDPLLRDWAQREAYIQLRYREENGLPLIDKNLVDPAKITLPSDEELGYTEIII
ncbi:NADH dehydrogenase [ubiquinone] 1 beta subcomplex subunit 11, mitochondrial [Ceratina calcarata]|uniref:NADH dehydrogenase [ubiquinone] 1 beta subcomplex subunit 11, mitochondrial n=1 Tax=Ceratina calcarata TaxID=156304 RepID=A0AAJ7JG07_9HYME|nr:NADH dehydrogenase [ubiquinone] 1 beta subcomplex subunit 11, mitochondrial [Ceratina calcarata]